MRSTSKVIYLDRTLDKGKQGYIRGMRWIWPLLVHDQTQFNRLHVQHVYLDPEILPVCEERHVVKCEERSEFAKDG